MSEKGLGILGGTFDPIHLGHLHIAEAVYDQIALDEIVFIPAFVPPHKLGQDYAPAQHRYAMTELAVRRFPIRLTRCVSCTSCIRSVSCILLSALIQ